MARISTSYLLILGLLTGIGPLCTDLYLPALPEISGQLATTSTLTQLTLTASLLGLGLGQLLFGPLSDRTGRKIPLLLSLLLFIASSVLCATTQDIHWLIIWRFVQGAAGAGGSVLSRSIARDKYQGVTLTQFFALLMTVNGIAPVLSPVLGGYIASTYDWRMLFWVMAGIAALLLFCCLLFISETMPQSLRTHGTSLFSAGRSVVKNRIFMRFCLIQSFMLAGLFAYIGSSSFTMQNEYGLTPIQFSLLFGLNGIGLIISSIIFSRLARRIMAITLLRGGLLLAVICALTTLLCSWLQHPILTLVALFFTMAFCSGISTVASAEAMSVVDAQESGTASALIGMSMFIFGGISAPLSGLGGETMLKMSLTVALCYMAALILANSGSSDLELKQSKHEIIKSSRKR
ncbi:TPA: Bcr/CflA family efflux MFS transporter [Escherichia coli]|nr:Bcr/CflA family efflux MFS transporter [Escherichia coli]HEL8044570.1 Bcr/CflA family efflux MFS transporter [Escherichia coli]HEL8054136.1 Bcr/CflA family efflux MFS transporter [Escherichia coli]HEL8058984.1 Bcr/CflA family efflux MFS transporter [Escherichia coli]HEL8103291.1 Bcr/CflA family efflux MFS transporter [Escherichia coli]